jgi:UMF1 family MFS transporter
MIIGPTSYGVISWASGGNQRLALISTLSFFVIGLVLLNTVDEARGRQAAADMGIDAPGADTGP